MKIRSGSTFALIALMAIMVAVIILSIELKDLKSSFLPLLFSITIFILAAVRLRKELLLEGKVETTGSDDDTIMDIGIRGDWRVLSIAGAWVFSFVLASYLLGFIPAMLLVTFFYTRTHGVGWLTSILMTILIPAIIWVIFELALKVILYRGLIFTLLGY